MDAPVFIAFPRNVGKEHQGRGNNHQPNIVDPANFNLAEGNSDSITQNEEDEIYPCHKWNHFVILARTLHLLCEFEGVPSGGGAKRVAEMFLLVEGGEGGGREYERPQENDALSFISH